MDNALDLYRKFTKGVAYFRVQFAAGNANPAVRRQLVDFEREVIDPFDAACFGLSPEDRRAMEDQI